MFFARFFNCFFFLKKLAGLNNSLHLMCLNIRNNNPLNEDYFLLAHDSWLWSKDLVQSVPKALVYSKSSISVLPSDWSLLQVTVCDWSITSLRSRMMLNCIWKLAVKIVCKIILDFQRTAYCSRMSAEGTAVREEGVTGGALWVWGRALAPRGSSITNAQLQRRRPTTSDLTK